MTSQMVRGSDRSTLKFLRRYSWEVMKRRDDGGYHLR
jgi:hypothetical protein